MPIPTTTSSDILLRSLLDHQVDDFDYWISIEDVVPGLPDLDVHFSDEARILPRSVQNDIEYLQHHRLLVFRPENPHVKLTPLGVYTALLFDIPKNAPTECV
jgi:hypothetical protein